jgi:hypothetical protein
MLALVAREWRVWRVASFLPARAHMHYALALAAEAAARGAAAAAAPAPPTAAAAPAPTAAAAPAAWPPARDALEHAQEAAAATLLRVLMGAGEAATAVPAPAAVGPSSLGPGAGNGLLATRDIGLGEVVAAYPGVVFGRPAAVSSAFTDGMDEPPEVVSPPPGSAYVMVRHELRVDAGGLVDAAALARLAAERTPWAVAHIANHPPAGTPPNVMELDVDIQLGRPPKRVPEGVAPPPLREPRAHAARVLPWERRGRVPYVWAPADFWRGSCVPPFLDAHDVDGEWWHAADVHGAIPVPLPAIVLVAARPIRAGEELWLDYGYVPPTSSRSSVPPWYAPTPPSAYWRILRGACAAAGLPLPEAPPDAAVADAAWGEAWKAHKGV